MAISLTSGFPIPRQQPPGPSSFDTSPRAVSSWLATLPKAHPEVAAEKLVDMVHAVNRLAISHDHRIHLLQYLGDQGYSILGPLHNKLRDVTSPPRKKELALAELIILLHQELALAYRIAISDPSKQKPVRKDLNFDRSRLIRTSLLHLGQTQKVHYLIKTPLENDVWSKVYTLYSIAAETGILEENAAEKEDQGLNSIEGTFKAILLMFLSAPESLRSIELGDLWRLIPNLVQYTRLLPAQEAAANEPAFLIGVDNGSIPRLDRRSNSTPTGRQHGPEYLKLEVAPLLSEIRHWLTAIYTHQETLNTHQDMRRKVLEHLLSHLEPQRKRQTRRLSGEFEIEVIAGFRHVHRFLTDNSGVARRDASHPIKETQPKQHLAAQIDYNVALNLELVDIESPLDRIENESNYPAREEEPDVRRAFCNTLNFSRDGYCLTTQGTGDFHLKVGEFVILREKNQDRCLPANACWVTSDGQELRFGVTLMAPFLLPGKAFSHPDQTATAEDCILLMDAKDGEPSRILLYSPCQPEGAPLRVEAGGRTLKLKLQQELSRTPGYVEYQCDAITEQGVGPESTPLFDDILKLGIPE